MNVMDSQKQDILQTISAMRPDLAERYTVMRIGIFGSFAREEAGQVIETQPIDFINKNWWRRGESNPCQ